MSNRPADAGQFSVFRVMKQTVWQIYVAEGIIPTKYHTDGVHIALAAVNDLDMIISMNFQHAVGAD